MRGQRGFALVITLIITALLVALTVEFVNEVFVDTSARQSFTDGQKASLLADSGVEAAIKLQKTLNKKSYTSQADLDLLNNILTVEDELGTIRVIVEDESGKLNINRAWGDNGAPLTPHSKIAESLVENIGLSKDLLQSLADWRDTADEPNPAGAETPYYGTLKPPYEARNGELATVEELRLVKGFNASVYNKVSPFVTVYGGLGATITININTAPMEVIAALSDDMTPGLAKDVVEYRKDHPFESLSDLENVPGMAGKIDLATQGALSVEAKVFRIHSEAIVNETKRIIEAVVDSGGQILYWREY